MLKLESPRTSGPQVKRVQEALLEWGYPLDKWGADGVFGPATALAVVQFQADNKLTQDGIVGPNVLAELGLADPEPSVIMSAHIVDRRGLHPHPNLFSVSRTKRLEPRGVTLHQMGCRPSDRPSRLDTLNAHIGVQRDGTVVICNDPTDFIWHAQGLSKPTIGIEYNGNFPGIATRPETAWSGGGGPHELTPAQLAASDRLFIWLARWFEDAGLVWDRVHAHRQSAESRRADPGSEIWQKVGLVWIKRLRDRGIDATDGGPGWKTGEGRPIPTAWDPSVSVAY